jgi:hypothetical protein
MVNYRDGILLEDTSAFLAWDVDVQKQAEQYGAEVITKGDRTTYKWGKHKILKGLRLYLTSHYWNFDERPEERVFDNIEFWAIGDKEAIKYDELIHSHLLANFGEASQDEIINGGEKMRHWIIANTKVSLHFFEMHCYRLCLKIENNRR